MSGRGHMICTVCGQSRDRIDGFPTMHFAVCWRCWLYDRAVSKRSWKALRLEALRERDSRMYGATRKDNSAP